MLSTLKADYLPALAQQIPPTEKELINVLLIEENKAESIAFEKILKKSADGSRFIMTTVPNISEALSLLINIPFDVIVAGLYLPDSLVTIETLRVKFPAITLIGLAGTKNEEIGLAAIQKGAQDFLVKNCFSCEALSLAIRFAIERQKTLIDSNAISSRNNHSAEQDLLTDLPSRGIFNDRLQQALARAKRNSGNFSVLFLDIDGFRGIVEAFDRRLGDLLLISISNRFKKVIRETDTVTRVGDDQFLFILDDLASIEDANTAGKKIISVFREPIVIDSDRYYVSASLGASIYSSDEKNSDASTAVELIELANAATYQARELGKNQFRFHSPKLNLEYLEISEKERALSKALDSDQLEIHYQPQVNLKTRTISGVQALLKWNHPEWGYLQAADFLQESSGLVLKLNQWLLDKVCRQLRDWHDNGAPNIHLFLRLSRSQLHCSELIPMISEALDRHKLVSSHLTFEVSESDIDSNWNRSINFLRNLKAIGVNLMLGHFRPETASIGNLRSIPLSAIKIEAGEITRLPKALLDLIHGLEFQSVIDGVETESQAQTLRNMGCQFAQGLLFGLPMLPELLNLK